MNKSLGSNVMPAIDSNPYAPPQTIFDRANYTGADRRRGWVAKLLVLQAVVIVVSLAVEAYQHESIVGSGPIFAFVGLWIAVVGLRNRDAAVFIHGFSAVAFSMLIVFLINYFRWSPAQGNRPITLLAFGYAAVALPTTCWLLTIRNPHEPPQQPAPEL